MSIRTPTRLLGALAGLACASAGAQTPVIVSAHWLAQHASDAGVVILAVSHAPDTYQAGHIPGARFVSYMDVTVDRNGLTTEIPDAAKLRDVFERAGVSTRSHVVLYSENPLMASRAFVALDYIGLRNVSILDGGLSAWRANGGTTTNEAPAPVRQGQIAVHERPSIVADAAWITAHRGAPHVRFIDTRTDGEYLGTGDRHGMPSSGHIAGARQLQWQELFTDPQNGQFHSMRDLAAIYAKRAPPGDTVVTYCWIGFRASMTYLVARALGYPAKLYDGSYQDWSQRNLPTTPGARP